MNCAQPPRSINRRRVDVAERGLIVNVVLFEVAPFHYQFDIFTLAHVSAHALARRFQRGLDTGEAAIMRDLKALGQAHHALADRPDGTDFVVPLVDGGNWRGSVELVCDPRIGYDRALTVRTYLVDGI